MKYLINLIFEFIETIIGFFIGVSIFFFCFSFFIFSSINRLIIFNVTMVVILCVGLILLKFHDKIRAFLVYKGFLDK
ncbi:hypothetical protein C5469_11165 [Photorhabdus cinerea]|uniref:Uncharacterized protein n=1 Tax=Photorhabdus cinerea TaxID=471575 RepID=A0A7X5QE48_9GAMM|nr:hypothetical protein [Photorhabdus cinerea]